MYTKLVLVLMVALPLLVSCDRPTHCDRHKGDSEFRCGKDGYRKDYISVRNISGDRVSFKVGKWYSTCGKPGVNYADDTYTLESGGHIDLEFSEASSGTCNELYVYQCMRQHSHVDCLSVVTVHPKV